MTPETFHRVLERLADAGWALKDIVWAENIQPPATPEDFAQEAIFVICNSGMRYTVAREIYERVMRVLLIDASASTVFRHEGKAEAIDRIWRNRESFYEEYMYRGPERQLEYLETLPWIGPTTKYHLAKNFGLQVVKPDVHLVRLAKVYDITPRELCERLAAKTGFKVATIDTLLWRACATGILDSKTGEFKA